MQEDLQSSQTMGPLSQGCSDQTIMGPRSYSSQEMDKLLGVEEDSVESSATHHFPVKLFPQNADMGHQVPET